MSPREARGAAILQDAGRPITKTARNKWLVPSQTTPALAYIVTRFAHHTKGPSTRWTCTCPDFETRGGTCKHQYAIHILLSINEPRSTPAQHATATDSPPMNGLESVRANLDTPACPHCSNRAVVKQGIKSGRQRYRCKPCQRNFMPLTGFDRIATDPQCVCLALDLAFKGLSLRKVTDTLQQFYAVEVGKSTVHRWMNRYVTLLNEYAETLTPQVGDKWHADEVFTKFSGKMQYVWHLMDAKTRYLLVSRVTEARNKKDARAVFDEARARAGKVPTEVVTDGLQAYADSFNGAFNGNRPGPQVTHTREIHLSRPEQTPNNNRIERLNGTLRERQKVTRGLKKPEGPLTRGHAAYYNLLRPHQALAGKTPAEAAGVMIASAAGNRWRRVIETSHEMA